MAWYLYLLECEGGSIYTGIAVNVEERFAKHLCGKGARYTRAYPPKKILAKKRYASRSLASKAEYATKLLSPEEKRALCAKLNAKRRAGTGKTKLQAQKKKPS
jgi:putative endonuclease